MSMIDRWNEEGLGEGSEIFPQCKTCRYRDRAYMTFQDIYDKDEFGWQKCFCQIYGKDRVLNTGILVPYLPIKSQKKPSEMHDWEIECQDYKQETRNKDELYNLWASITKRYKEEYIKAYKPEELNEYGVPIKKNFIKETIIWKKIKEEFPEMDINIKEIEN